MKHARKRATLWCMLVAIGCAFGCSGEGRSQENAATQPTASTQSIPGPVSTPRAGIPAGAPRVVILGFDGMEPSIVEAMQAAGELPNFEALRKQGSYEHLETSIPPQSPTAWSSFATCSSSGRHGIIDFLRRKPANYMPDVGFGRTEPPQLTPDGSVSRPARSVSYRRGESFWSVADKQGVRCKVLHVPFAYPPDQLENGWMLCGEGVPDIRGATTNFFSLSDVFTAEQLGERLAGGQRLALNFQGDAATVNIPGYPDPRNRGHYVEVPLTVTVDRAARVVTLEVQGQKAIVPDNGWSSWLEWKFEVTPQYVVHAISYFHVLEAGEHVRLYMSSLQFDPKDPYVPFTSPPGYAGELADRGGLYKTIGWTHDTHALRQDALTDDAFLEDEARNDAWLETLTLDEIQRGDFQLLISVWTSTDRTAHMFWRFRDPQHPLYTEEGARKYGRVVEDSYRRMDAIVGKVAAQLQPADLLLILSDHGFHSFRKGFSLNTWLVRNGYLGVQGKPDAATAYTEDNQDFLQGFDWAQSRAYGFGLSSLYLNLKGREGKGIVDPSEAPALLAELKDKLLHVTDPETGKEILSALYTRADFEGESDPDAPDLQLGYVDGYQTSKASVKGAVTKDLFESNSDKWSGEHASSDVAATSGVLLSNKALEKKAAIVDLGVTALKYLGLSVPKEYEGKPLL